MRNPQVSATIDEASYKKVVEWADKNSRSLSEMVAILLLQAIKEKERKTKRKKNGLQQNKD
jgi:hypothetical protein